MKRFLPMFRGLALSIALLASHGSFADATQPSPPQTQQVQSDGKGYINSDGNWIHSPVHADSPPAGATAQCRDGTYSFSQHHQGTCSHHGGVAAWL